MDRIDLAGTWDLSHTGGNAPTPIDRVHATVPGNNITPLIEAGIIPDPYVSAHELEVQWIGRCDWAFERRVNLDHRFVALPSHFFSFDSLDTVASVRVNGTVVGCSDNMFARVRLEVPHGILKPGENTIEVAFASPEISAAKRAEGLPYPVPHSQNPVQSQHRNLLRKVQCHSGWDWGPCLMSSGIYGRTELVGSSDPILEYASCEIDQVRDGVWQIVVTPTFRSGVNERRAGGLSVAVRSPSGAVVATEGQQVIAEPGVHAVEPLSFLLHNPQIWWPAGEGSQPLYSVEVAAFGDEIRKQIGFRELAVRRETDEFGESFAVVVNGRPVFAKGANWIPMDALPSRTTSDHLHHLLESAVAANMNMIRVWGGGTYESDRFYDLCDELGILIWQDFMFACALYPADSEFLDSVRAEVSYQVLRLKDHPCIALWCGNNENIAALNWYEESRANRDRYLVNYDRLNEGVIGQTARALDPQRLFWPSSPTDGLDDYSDDWVADQQGDMHYWSVWHGGLPFAAYRAVVPRFCSEFGFQSFPSSSGVDQYARSGHRNVTAPDMEHHQRNPRGNTTIIQTMSRYFRFPSGFEDQLYLSQVQQAWAIQTAVEYWRCNRPRCMGAIYWQLNDTWPVASWSSIEYGGKWKLLHYAARRFFDPILLAAIPVDADGGVIADEEVAVAGYDIFVVNDTQLPLRGILTVSRMKYDGAAVGSPQSVQVSAEPCTARCFTNVATTVSDSAPEVAYGVAQLTMDDGVLRTTQFFLASPKRSELADPNIKIEVMPSDAGAEVRVRASAPAFHVALDAGAIPGRFTDNDLYVHPNRPAIVKFLARPGTKNWQVPPISGDSLSVRSLYDTYS